VAHKKWISEEKRRQIAERKWLESYRPPERRVSGEFYYPIPREVFDSLGGVDKVMATR
jgi:hypothetical protein